MRRLEEDLEKFWEKKIHLFKKLLDYGKVCIVPAKLRLCTGNHAPET